MKWKKWNSTVDKGRHVATIFINISKTFNIKKLTCMGFVKVHCQIVTFTLSNSYLKNILQRVSFDSAFSASKDVITGVTQVSILGPFISKRHFLF